MADVLAGMAVLAELRFRERISVEVQHAAAKFFWFVTESGGVKRSGNHP